MKSLWISFVLWSMQACADLNQPNAWLSATDLSRINYNSNVSVKNFSGHDLTVYGLYIKKFAYTSSNQSCENAQEINLITSNIAVGSNVMPITMPLLYQAPIGANYLYNMILGANYYIYVNYPISPPGCALPGCTWGSDTNIYRWCLVLGAISPSASNQPSYQNAKVSPYAEALLGVGYDYKLNTDDAYIGPINCDDRSLTCTVAQSQMQMII